MRRIFAVYKRDLAHVKNNVIALLVCLGLTIMPSLYAWVNIVGGWDPYGNTDQVKVAVASSDEGFQGTIVPVSINVGQKVIAALAENDKIDFVVSQEDSAIEGVRSGEYYAAVIIPRNFSTNLLSALSQDATNPALDYYVNEKRNAIASIVTNKASGSVQNSVNTAFSEAITQAGADILDEISNKSSEDALLSVANKLVGTLDTTIHSTQQVGNDLAMYQSAVASIHSTLNAAGALLGDNAISLDLSNKLTNAADEVRAFDDKISAAADVVSNAVNTGIERAGTLESDLDEAFDKANGQLDRVGDGLDKVSSEAHARRDSLQGLYDRICDLDENVKTVEKNAEKSGSIATIDLEYIHTTSADVSDIKARVKNALEYANNLISKYDQLLADLQTSRSDAETSRATLKDMAAKVREIIEAVRTDYDENLAGSLLTLADKIDKAADDASYVSSTLHSTVDALKPAISRTSSDLDALENSLGTGVEKINEAVDTLTELRDKLSVAVSEGDMGLIRTILSSDASGLADFLAAPVVVDREPFFAVQNNGSAMTPYYTTMALWVGGTLMGVLLYVGISEEAKRETKAELRHAYFGRLLFFLTIGALQSTILLLGDMFFLGVQCENPLLFLLTGWLASTVFINIIYSLASSFGDVGKAIAVLFMVIQVAGSGGTFPREMLPPVFQVLYPFLPFVHSENAMRAAMFGTYANDWQTSMLTLAAYLIPALLLGLVLRKPLVRANEWIEEKLEETKIM